MWIWLACKVLLVEAISIPLESYLVSTMKDLQH